jgi:hypothetical protein
MIIFDIETDGLYDEVTKVYCMSYTEDGNVSTTTTPDLVCDVLASYDVLVGHNIALYDLLVLKKLYGFDYSNKLIIDTLWLSWYLDPGRSKHGLEDHGEELGYPKVKVEKEEWAEGNMDLMVERCSRDVLINWKLWKKQEKMLKEMYP